MIERQKGVTSLQSEIVTSSPAFPRLERNVFSFLTIPILRSSVLSSNPIPRYFGRSLKTGWKNTKMTNDQSALSTIPSTNQRREHTFIT
jgi:hypothetical protein